MSEIIFSKIKFPLFLLWVCLFGSCSNINSDSGNPAIIVIDTTIIDNTGPVSIESYGLEFTEFYCQKRLEHFENWNVPLIRNQKLIFYNFEGSKREQQYFAVFDEGKNSLFETFETNVEWGIINTLHFFESTGNYLIFFMYKKLLIYNRSTKESTISETNWSCHAGVANSDSTMIVLGVEGPDNEKTPSLIEISDKGEIGRIKSFPNRTLSKLSAHPERLFNFNKSIFWFSRKDLSLYEVDKDLNISPILRIEAENMVTYEEESDPYKMSPLSMNNFENRAYVHPGIRLMRENMIIHLKIDTKSFALVINLKSLEYQLNKNYRLQNNDGIYISAYVGLPGSISVVVPVNEDYEDRIFKNVQDFPEYRGPSAIYIK